MTQDELLAAIRQLKLRLLSTRVDNFFLHSNQPDSVQKRFVSFRDEVSILEGRLSNAALATIAAKLDELSEDIKAGIANLQREIDKLNNTIAVLDTLGSVIGLVTRVVTLAT